MAVPIETHFIPLFSRWLRLWGDLREPARIEALLRAIEAFTRIWIYLGIRSRNPEKMESVSLLPSLAGLGPEQLHGYADLLERAFAGYARGLGRSAWADKSAPYEPEDLDLYAAGVAGLKVVHLIRDGRDVWISWRNHWFGPRTLAEAAWIWRRHIETRRRWGRAHPSQYIEVRYEDLLEHPAEELGRLARFLGVSAPQAATLAGSSLTGAYRTEATHEKLAGELDPTNREKWKSRMSAGELEIFQHIAGRTLLESGYRVDGNPVTPIRRAALGVRWSLGMLRRYLSATYYLRRVRDISPLLLGAAQRAGIDVQRLSRRLAAWSAAGGA